MINRLITSLRCFNLSISGLRAVCSVTRFLLESHISKYPCLKHLSVTGKCVLLDPYNWAEDRMAFKNYFQGIQYSDLC